MQRIKVWDLPVRLFHWSLVVLVAAAWVTQEANLMDWHVRCGTAILALLLFRVIWGFAGSDTARFGRFLRSPAAALRHLSHLRRREADREIGHNAAGGWMVLVMLALLGVQAGTGLFSNDDGNTEGPLMHLVDKEQSDWLSKVHALNFNLVLGVIVLHVLAIGAYAVFKRQNLVRPMLTGTKAMEGEVVAPRLVSPVWALAALAAAVGIVVWVVGA
ncbi:cytochrome b/b6 domain-containing protein [Rhodopila globiformis]|uniref:Hydrogenase n=1 Tax=Rhodopila globiformis TaxID=1071 RepID=A0A2S6NE19_RHOGL|nr:cytochrome b/b6 domain-containing protein [Rhodopila globiformis]PPQ32895.1 hydrogenase [Rhodopila globiformis]